MIVRELITLLGVELDNSDVKKVDGAVNRFEDRMRKVGQFIGGSIFLAGFARATGAAIKFASDARETLNLVRESFGENAADVEAWSTTVAREVGRSEFLMRELAGTLGALLNPLMGGNTEAAAEMSTQLATLAVDLASFFNVTERDALTALRAGLSGETEPLKRFGVILTEVGLKEQARTEGLNKSIKSMSIAEKTALRFRTILAQTKSAQGDAARTANEFANAERAAADGLRDVATQIGLRLLPVATRFQLWVRDTARDLVELAQKTHIFEAALIVVGGAIAALAFLMVAPFIGFLITAAKVLAVVAAITLAVDDLITFFSGGKSVIGEFIDTLFGIGAAQEFIDSLNAGWETMAGWWQDLIEFGATFHGWLEDIGNTGERVLKSIANGIDSLFGEGTAASLGSAVSRFFGVEQAQQALGQLQGETADLRSRRRAVGRGSGSSVVGSRRGSTAAQLRLERARQLQARRDSGESLTRRQRMELRRITDRPADTQLRSVFATALATAPARAPAARSGGNVTQSNTFHVESTDPDGVAREVQRVLERSYEDAGAALAEGAE